MKKIVFILPVLFAAGLLFIASTTPQEEDKLNFITSDEVKEAVMHSCYGCHSDEATNDKPKDKLNFDKWADYTDAEKVSALVDICEVLEAGEMPPEKFLEKYPDRALKEGQAEMICDWSDQSVDELMGE